MAIVVFLACPLGAACAAERPDWAFFLPSADPATLATPRAAPATTWTAPGSRKSYTIAELHDVLAPPDWYPNEHGPTPAIVARGSRAGANSAPLLPCALCHLPNGAGHVESASLAGLPAPYIERQFLDWRSGVRKITVGDANTAAFLTALKRRYSTEQVHDAARYFASLQMRAWIRVVEADTVPVSAVSPQTLMRLPIPERGSELLGERIVELPEDPERLVYRDSHSGFVAFVPQGSIAAGEALVTHRSRTTIVPCATCHGSRLAGLANVPPLAGRPPTYIVRQLWSFQSGERAAESSAFMRVLAANLTVAQMLSIAAYLASCPPQ